ncbi:MAG: DNA repair protein RecN [Ancrocorticia sp.]|jgi:DNA repair protein RecN (Recombination protein N)|nr:DNA repair protein RecN [Ancrocorticia sp.]MCI2001299.1 DNA repair protein RecN [Ancrocorticia sp.]MCI2012376.1 DNA repair protein RecN [Ancrocorticia sp.]
MIEHVRISHLGVIDEAELDFGAGLTALTGETGAGKTMAVTSLALLLGGKADPRKVRRGAEAAHVEGTFTVPLDSPVLARILDAGGQWEDDGDSAVVLVARTVPAHGRSRAFVGGHSVPTAVLREIASALVTVHGQSDQVRLATSAHQRAALDAFGGSDIAVRRSAWRDAWHQLTSARDSLTSFERQAKDVARRRLALEALVDKVAEVAPATGEEQALRAEAQRLEHSEENYAGLSQAAAYLSGSDTVEHSAVERVSAAYAALAHVTDDVVPLRERLDAVQAELGDIAATVSDMALHTEADPGRLEEIYARRQTLAGLRKTLGMDIDEAIEVAASAQKELEALQDPDRAREELRARVEEAEQAAEAAAVALTRARKKSADELSQLVEAELPDLALPDAHFVVDVSEAEPTVWGKDDVVFRLSSHPQALLAPLGSGASGGELSRVMLAVEVALATHHHETSHTFLFDEVDAGVGGRAALAVGKRLAELGATNQVIVVTHLAQVAAYATSHAVVVKNTEGETTATHVVQVRGEERIAELARMLSGSVTQAARAHAADLLSRTNVAR